MGLLCCILLLCALTSKCKWFYYLARTTETTSNKVLYCVLYIGGKSKSAEFKDSGDGGIELQDNSLYDRHQKSKQEAEFPPDAYESQYEPSPKERDSVLLRPRPTHPTTDELNQPQPLYDSLGPSGRQRSTISIGSGKELPNPLYSGLPAKSTLSRPTSQQNNSGSGIVHNADRGVDHSGEPLYSEANEPLANDALYTEPGLPVLRGSRRFESPPPPPPDPSSIPAYAEAGPAMASQEHLYTELHNPDISSTHLPNRTPVFHVPPPPPPETPGKYLSDSSQEATWTEYLYIVTTSHHWNLA